MRKYGSDKQSGCPEAGAGKCERSQQMDAPTSSPRDYFPPELVCLLGTATQVIDQHVNDHGFCADCGSIWPCERAQLAEFALATL